MSDFGLGGGAPGLGGGGGGGSLIKVGGTAAVGTSSGSTPNGLTAAKAVGHGYHAGAASALTNAYGQMRSQASGALPTMHPQPSSSQKMMVMASGGDAPAMAMAGSRHPRALGAAAKMVSGGHAAALRLASATAPPLGPMAGTGRAEHAQPLSGQAPHHNWPPRASRARAGPAPAAMGRTQELDLTHMPRHAEPRPALDDGSLAAAAAAEAASHTANLEKRQREARQNLIKVTDVRQITGFDTRSAASTGTKTARSRVSENGARGREDELATRTRRRRDDDDDDDDDDNSTTAVGKSALSARRNGDSHADLRLRRASMNVSARYSRDAPGGHDQATAHGDAAHKRSEEYQTGPSSSQPRTLDSRNALEAQEDERWGKQRQRKDPWRDLPDTISTSSLPHQTSHGPIERDAAFDGGWHRRETGDRAKWHDAEAAPCHRSASALYAHAHTGDGSAEPTRTRGIVQQPHGGDGALDGGLGDRHHTGAQDGARFVRGGGSGHGLHAKAVELDYPPAVQLYSDRQPQHRHSQPSLGYDSDSPLLSPSSSSSLLAYASAVNHQALATEAAAAAPPERTSDLGDAGANPHARAHQRHQEHHGSSSSINNNSGRSINGGRSGAIDNGDDRGRATSHLPQGSFDGVLSATALARGDSERLEARQAAISSRPQVVPSAQSPSPPAVTQHRQQHQQQAPEEQQQQQYQYHQQPQHQHLRQLAEPHWAPQSRNDPRGDEHASIEADSLYHAAPAPGPSLVITRLVQAQAQLAMRLDAAEAEIAASRDTIERQRHNEQRLRADLAELARVTDGRLGACEEGLRVVERSLAEALERSLHAARQGAALSDQVANLAASQRQMRQAVAVARRRASKPAFAVWGVALCDTELYSCLPCDFERMVRRQSRRNARRQRILSKSVGGNSGGRRGQRRGRNAQTAGDSDSAYHGRGSDNTSDESDSYATDDDDDDDNNGDNANDSDSDTNSDGEGGGMGGDTDVDDDHIDIVTAEKGSWHVVHYPSCQATDADGRVFVWMRTVSVDPSTSLCRFWWIKCVDVDAKRKLLDRFSMLPPSLAQSLQQPQHPQQHDQPQSLKRQVAPGTLPQAARPTPKPLGSALAGIGRQPRNVPPTRSDAALDLAAPATMARMPPRQASAATPAGLSPPPPLTAVTAHVASKFTNDESSEWAAHAMAADDGLLSRAVLEADALAARNVAKQLAAAAVDHVQDRRPTADITRSDAGGGGGGGGGGDDDLGAWTDEEYVDDSQAGPASPGVSQQDT